MFKKFTPEIHVPRHHIRFRTTLRKETIEIPYTLVYCIKIEWIIK